LLRKIPAGVVAATGGIALFYFLTFILGFFHIDAFQSVYGAGSLGSDFSIFVVIVAALNLVLDFDFIETGVNSGAPEIYGVVWGLWLMSRSFWLYLEILRLLSKLRSRD